GAFVRAIKCDLLPAADLQVLQKLLTAVLHILPVERVKELRYQSATSKPREFWMLPILPACFHRGVDLMVGDGTDAPQALVDTALVMQNFQHSDYVYNEDYQSLRTEIRKYPGFRRRVARAIALSEDVGFAVYDLTWRGLVGFTREDLGWLLREAGREDIDLAERQIWYKVARNIACYDLRGKRRQQALAALTTGVDGPARADDVKTARAQR